MALKRPDPKLDHDYDGIEELDYPAPAWFNAIFWGSIVFAICYFLYYHHYDGASLAQEFEAGQKEHAALVRQLNPPRVFTAAEVAFAEKDAATLARGRANFEAKCAPCHLKDGGGQTGPNLTDDFWINGDGTTPFLVRTLQDGVQEKGMPAWEDKFQPEEILAIAAYVRSLRGTTPANPKAPEGNAVAN
ncbi:MAG: c-type cytochrome [Holophagaceae bacterium]